MLRITPLALALTLGVSLLGQPAPVCAQDQPPPGDASHHHPAPQASASGSTVSSDEESPPPPRVVQVTDDERAPVARPLRRPLRPLREHHTERPMRAAGWGTLVVGLALAGSGVGLFFAGIITAIGNRGPAAELLISGGVALGVGVVLTITGGILLAQRGAEVTLTLGPGSLSTTITF